MKELKIFYDPEFDKYQSDEMHKIFKLVLFGL
jgi:hypothetical protein